jgi:hypothetical protein
VVESLSREFQAPSFRRTQVGTRPESDLTAETPERKLANEMPHYHPSVVLCWRYA